MAYFRHVIAKSLPVRCFSLAVDATRLAYRILAPTTSFYSVEGAEYGDVAELSTTAQLASSSTPAVCPRLYKIEGQDYGILAEAIIDKTSAEFKRMWVPGAHFVTHYFGGRMHVDIKGGLTFFDRRNTAEYCRYKGGLWLFDLWVRNPDDPVTECARSITTTSDAIVITNVEDLGEEWSADDVMMGGVSKWLNLGYRLTAESETVAPDGWATFKLEILDGKSGEVATDVNWSGWILEAVDGYCPHRRVTTTNGVGTFRVQALGLLPGESMRVKINHHFFTGRIEATVQVEKA